MSRLARLVSAAVIGASVMAPVMLATPAYATKDSCVAHLTQELGGDPGQAGADACMAAENGEPQVCHDLLNQFVTKESPLITEACKRGEAPSLA